MSSGRSSHVAACFSLERTKYLMLSKSMPPRSEPQRRHGLAVEELEALQAQVEHPLRLALLRGDVAHDLLAQAALGGGAGDVGVAPAEVVAADALELGVALVDGGHEVTCSFFSRGSSLSVRPGRVRGARDAGGAHPVAVGDGGQPLHVAAEHAADGLGLGLAQLGELVGDVRDGAVLLAQLLAHGHVARAGGVPLVGEDPGQHLGRARAAGSAAATTPKRCSMNATRRVGELPDGGVAAGLVEEAQRLHGEVVVLLVEALAAGLGEREHLGRAAAAARGRGCAARGPRRVPSSSSWSRWRRTAAGVRSSRSASAAAVDGPVDQDRPDDALARRLVVRPGGVAR